MLIPTLRSVMRPVLAVKPASVALAILLGVGSFSPAVLFPTAAQPGVHFETYDPNTILQRRNLLTWSEDFGNAAWGKNFTASVTGTNTVNLPADGDWVTQRTTGVGIVPGQTFTGMVELSGAGTVKLRIARVDSGTYEESVSTVTLTATPAVYSLSHTFAFSQTGARLDVVRASTTATTVTANKAQLERGTLTGYQKVTDWNTEFMAAGGDRVTMFLDPACTIPVTKPEDLIGGFISSERGTTKGANRAPAIHSANWNVTGADATHVITFDDAAGTVRYQSDTTTPVLQLGSKNPILTVGKWYEVAVFVSAYAGGSLKVDDGGGSGAVIASKAGWNTALFRAVGVAFLPYRNSANVDITIGFIGIREVPGVVATQPIAGSKPKLDARVNLLRATEQLADAAWLKTAGGTGAAPVVTDRFGAGPDGTMTASRVQFNRGAGVTTADFSYLGQSPGGLTVGADVRSAVWLKSNDGTPQDMVMVGAGGGGVFITVTGEWKLFSVTQATFSTGVDPARLLLRGDRGGNATADILYWHPDVRTAADAALDIPAYQAVRTPTDYDTEGYPHRVKFDGIDDFLSFPLDMSTTDKLTAWVGGQVKSSDAANQAVFELTATSTSTVGGFALFAPVTAAVADFGARANGSVIPAPPLATPATYPAPRNAVVALEADIATDRRAILVNGIEVAADVGSDMGTGTYANGICYWGSRAGTSLFTSGGHTSLTIRGAATSVGEHIRMNRYLARRARIPGA